VRTDPARVWAIVVGCTIPAAYVVAIVATVLVGRDGSASTSFGWAFVYGIVMSPVMCALVSIAVTRPRTRRTITLATVIGALAGLAPIAFITFFRLSMRTCTGLNFLALPWPEPLRTTVQVVAGIIWVASTVVLIVAVARPPLRWAGIAMWIWTGVIAIPTFLLLFLSFYGDPGTDCLPI